MTKRRYPPVIISKAPSDAYDEGYDRIFSKTEPIVPCGSHDLAIAASCPGSEGARCPCFYAEEDWREEDNQHVIYP